MSLLIDALKRNHPALREQNMDCLVLWDNAVGNDSGWEIKPGWLDIKTKSNTLTNICLADRQRIVAEIVEMKDIRKLEKMNPVYALQFKGMPDYARPSRVTFGVDDVPEAPDCRVFALMAPEDAIIYYVDAKHYLVADALKRGLLPQISSPHSYSTYMINEYVFTSAVTSTNHKSKKLGQQAKEACLYMQRIFNYSHARQNTCTVACMTTQADESEVHNIVQKQMQNILGAGPAESLITQKVKALPDDAPFMLYAVARAR